MHLLTAPPGSALLFRPRQAPLRCQGTATVEFLLAFPIVLFLALILGQMMLLMTGRAFVLHSAAMAARSAIVQVPAQPINEVTAEKLEAVQRAATAALLPVAGQATAAGPEGQMLADALSQHFAAYNRTTPNWVARQSAQRWQYAAEHTAIRLESWPLTQDTDAPVGGGPNPYVLGPVDDLWTTLEPGDRVGPRHPLRVVVSHRLHLAVPYVSWVFADGWHSTEAGRTPYVVITDRYTLTNEGEDADLFGPATSPSGTVVPRIDQ